MEIEYGPVIARRRPVVMIGGASLILIVGAVAIFVAVKPSKPETKAEVKADVKEKDAKGKMKEKESKGIVNDDPSQYPPGPPSEISAIKYVTEPPPATEIEFRRKYTESPKPLIYSTSDKVYYSYSQGERMYWRPSMQLWYGGSPK
jgi:hypothetical protein